MKKGKIIVIDGTDGSGKGTQTEILITKLKQNSIPAADLDFPQYESFFGQMVGSYLRGEYGDISPKLASVLFAANRMEFRDQIKSWLDEGKIVVLNRYVTANQIHQAARISDPEEKKQFLKWLSDMEYKVFGLPKPDLVVFLEVPPEISFELVAKKDPSSRSYSQGIKHDILEADVNHQKQALNQIGELLSEEYQAVKINCAPNNQMATREEIADLVWNEVKKVI